MAKFKFALFFFAFRSFQRDSQRSHVVRKCLFLSHRQSLAILRARLLDRIATQSPCSSLHHCRKPALRLRQVSWLMPLISQRQVCATHAY